MWGAKNAPNLAICRRNWGTEQHNFSPGGVGWPSDIFCLLNIFMTNFWEDDLTEKHIIMSPRTPSCYWGDKYETKMRMDGSRYCLTCRSVSEIATATRPSFTENCEYKDISSFILQQEISIHYHINSFPNKMERPFILKKLARLL